MRKLPITALLFIFLFGNWMCESAHVESKQNNPKAPKKEVSKNTSQKKSKGSAENEISEPLQATTFLEWETISVDETRLIESIYPDYLEKSIDSSGAFVGVSLLSSEGTVDHFSLEGLEAFNISDIGKLYLLSWENLDHEGDKILEPVWEHESDSAEAYVYCESSNLLRYGGSNFQWQDPAIESLIRLNDGTIRLTIEQSWTHEASNTRSSEKSMFLLSGDQVDWLFDYISFEGYQDFYLKDQINTNAQRLEKMLELIPNMFYKGMVSESYSELEFGEHYSFQMPDLILTEHRYELDAGAREILDEKKRRLFRYNGKRYIEVLPIES